MCGLIVLIVSSRLHEQPTIILRVSMSVPTAAKPCTIPRAALALTMQARTAHWIDHHRFLWSAAHQHRPYRCHRRWRHTNRYSVAWDSHLPAPVVGYHSVRHHQPPHRQRLVRVAETFSSLLCLKIMLIQVQQNYVTHHLMEVFLSSLYFDIFLIQWYPCYVIPLFCHFTLLMTASSLPQCHIIYPCWDTSPVYAASNARHYSWSHTRAMTVFRTCNEQHFLLKSTKKFHVQKRPEVRIEEFIVKVMVHFIAWCCNDKMWYAIFPQYLQTNPSPQGMPIPKRSSSGSIPSVSSLSPPTGKKTTILASPQFFLYGKEIPLCPSVIQWRENMYSLWEENLFHKAF